MLYWRWASGARVFDTVYYHCLIDDISGMERKDSQTGPGMARLPSATNRSSSSVPSRPNKTPNGSFSGNDPSIPNPTSNVTGTISEQPQSAPGAYGGSAIPSQFKLISVNFKEAALDTPSYRAAVNHLDFQVDNIEKWLRAFLASHRKIPKSVKELQAYTNSFLEHIVPTFIQDGLIDQEYTVQLLQTSLEALKTVWDESFAALSMNSYAIDNMNLAVFAAINRYKELRVAFDSAQEKYDKFLGVFMSTPKTKDPSIVLEDARQLFQVRKTYTHASLELITELLNLGSLLDSLLVKLSNDFWKRKKPTFSLGVVVNTNLQKMWDKLTRIQAWSDSYSVSVDSLKDEMLSARAQVESSLMFQFQPSANLNDYKTSMINTRTLADITENGIEKHGFLFMKTWIDVASKPVWVKRWVFVKGGVFGLLVLSPSKTFVQETDKIGLLLCSVRYAPNEDRRFCFEIKTIDTTIIFQAETLLELKSWLKVFENERQRVLHQDSSNVLFNIASGRYPPIVTEFASTINTVTDRQLTHQKIVNLLGQIITSSKLLAHIHENERFFKRHIYFQIPQIRPPFMTDSTRSSIISYSISAATTLPTALTANIWGSVNWGLYYLQEVKYLNNHRVEKVVDTDSGSDDEDGPIRYPDYFPAELIPLDIQMRALFETAVEQDDFCLLLFRCIWLPNLRQELSGRCFVTGNFLYFYMQLLGFTALTKVPIEHLVAVESVLRKNVDVLKLTSLNGIIRIKLFVDDVNLIKQKLVYLINNKASDEVKHLHEVVNQLISLENQHYAEEQANLKEDTKKPELVDSSLPSFAVSDETAKKVHYTSDYSDVARLVMSKTYQTRPRALFHILLGDNSLILTSNISFAVLGSVTRAPWMDTEKGLLREINMDAKFDNRMIGRVRVTQVVDQLLEDEFYLFTLTKLRFQLFCGTPFSVTYRVVIKAETKTHSSITLWASTDFQTSTLLTWWFHLLGRSFFSSESRRIHRKIQEAVATLGSTGQNAQAVYVYGKLTKTSVPYDVAPVVITPLSVSHVLKVISRKIGWLVLRITAAAGLFVVNMVVTLLKGLRMNLILLGIIAILALTNVFLAGKTTRSYWVARRADNLAHNLLEAEPMMMLRAVYSRDVQDLMKVEMQSVFNRLESECFKAFQSKSFVVNYDHVTSWNHDYGDEATRATAQGLQLALHDIGVKRHELLVRLKMLNDMEKELARGEWRNWLVSELQMCQHVRESHFDELVERKEEDEGDVKQGLEYVMGYCRSCAQDLQSARALL